MDNLMDMNEFMNLMANYDPAADASLTDFMNAIAVDYAGIDYNYFKLWPVIQEEFQLGSTMEEAFRNIYRKRGQNPPSFSMIHDWLKELYDQNFVNSDKRPSSFDEGLRSAIIGQYLKLTKAMYFSDDWKFIRGEAILHSRFIFVISEAQPKTFSIIDSFTGERRELQGPSEEFKEPYLAPVWIGIDRILILCSDRFRTVWLRLLKIDWDESKWSILDTVVCHIHSAQIIVDSADSQKFVLFHGGVDGTLIRKGYINGDQILMDEQSIRFHAILYYPKFEDGKMYAFQVLRNEELDSGECYFCEYIIAESPAQRVNTVQAEIRFAELHYNYVWSKNKLYVLEDEYCMTHWFIIISFDPVTCSWSQTNLAGSALPTKLFVDDDDILTVDAVDTKRGGEILSTDKSIYRFPMRKPDNLRYLAWSTIRRGSLFFGSDLYERLAPRLPYNSEFRSFLESG